MRKDLFGSDLRIVQIQADDGPWWRMRDNVVEVAKRTVPGDLCDTRDYPGCGGPLYRWSQPTTLDYWPVVRCENHLKLQSLWKQYQEEAWSRIDGPSYDEKLRPLNFWDWLREHWEDDTSSAEIGPYWDLIMAERRINGHHRRMN